MISSEERVQNHIRERLELLDIYPHSIIFTTCCSELEMPVLSITFFTLSDLDQLLKALDYDKLCDKSDFTVFRETNTLILKGTTVVYLYMDVL